MVEARGPGTEDGAVARSAIPRIEPLLLLALAAVVLWQGIGHTPFIDEMNHLLAAESLLDHGDLRIAGGRPYDRGLAYTLLVAGALAIRGGASLVAARMPAYLFGVLLVLAAFLWTRRFAGRAAAWAAALVLLFSPITLYLSQQARFYTFHALAFLMVVVITHRLLEPPGGGGSGGGGKAGSGAGVPGEAGRGEGGRGESGRGGGRSWGRPALVAALAAAALVALHLQVTTVVGLVALLAWVCAAILLRRDVTSRRTTALVGVAAAVLAVAAVTVAADVGPLPRLWHLYRTPDLWSEEAAGEPLYYFRLLRGRFPVLLALLPASAVVALRRDVGFGSLLATLLLVPLAVHSFGGWKSERYIFYIYPYFAILNGVGIAALLGWIVRPLPPSAELRAQAWLRRGVPAAAALAAVALLFLASPGFRLTARMLTTADADWTGGPRYRGEPDWAGAAPHLRPRVDRDAFVVASSGLKAVHYLGRVDAVLMRNEVDHGELGIYPKLAVPALSEPASVELLVACRPRGLIVIDAQHWGVDYAVPPAAARAVERLARPIPLPEAYRLRAFEWSHEDTGADPARCAPLRRPEDGPRPGS